MTKDDFCIAGKMCKRVSWTDEDLEKVIESLRCVIAFLEGRNDAEIVASKLRLELNTFEQMANERVQKKAMGIHERRMDYFLGL